MTYMEVIAETAVDVGTEVDEAIIGRDDAFDDLPVYVGEHDVLAR